MIRALTIQNTSQCQGPDFSAHGSALQLLNWLVGEGSRDSTGARDGPGLSRRPWRRTWRRNHAVIRTTVAFLITSALGVWGCFPSLIGIRRQVSCNPFPPSWLVFPAVRPPQDLLGRIGAVGGGGVFWVSRCCPAMQIEAGMQRCGEGQSGKTHRAIRRRAGYKAAGEPQRHLGSPKPCMIAKTSQKKKSVTRSFERSSYSEKWIRENGIQSIGSGSVLVVL